MGELCHVVRSRHLRHASWVADDTLRKLFHQRVEIGQGGWVDVQTPTSGVLVQVEMAVGVRGALAAVIACVAFRYSRCGRHIVRYNFLLLLGRRYRTLESQLTWRNRKTLPSLALLSMCSSAKVASGPRARTRVCLCVYGLCVCVCVGGGGAHTADIHLA